MQPNDDAVHWFIRVDGGEEVKKEIVDVWQSYLGVIMI